MAAVLDILTQYADAFIEGLRQTLRLASIIWSTGLFFGIILGTLGARYPKAIGWPSATTAFVLSGIPVMVFLFWLHYPAQSLLNLVIDPFYTAAITLSIVNLFTVAEIVRRALKDFPSQYLIAAQVCGMPKLTSFIHIQFPLVLKEILPGLLMSQVGMLQATLFASLISVNEVFRTAQQINATIYKPVEIYTSLGVLFLSVCLPLNGLALWLRNKFTRDLSEK
jgi:His/Glu/Gln/Arg/opine family amino acid ABC transporter permease subunit